MVRICIPDDDPTVINGTEALEHLQRLGDVDIYTQRFADDDELCERLQGCEVAVNIRAYCKFPEALMERCPELKLISIWGTGTDNVDLEAARRRGVTVTNTPATASEPIAEHCLMMAMAIGRNLVALHNGMVAGEWVLVVVGIRNFHHFDLDDMSGHGRMDTRLDLDVVHVKFLP